MSDPVHVVVMATSLDDGGLLLGKARYRRELWPVMLYGGDWIDIGGNDEEIESVRLKRTKEGMKYLLIDVPIGAGRYEDVERDPSWSDTPEAALGKEPV